MEVNLMCLIVFVLCVGNYGLCYVVCALWLNYYVMCYVLISELYDSIDLCCMIHLVMC
jgi:hypothetical protein